MEFHAWAPLFYFPRRYIKLTTCINNLHYEKFQDGTVKCIEDEIPFEVPEGWAWSRLVSLTAIITNGASPKWQGVDYTSSGTMFITSENVEVETLLLESPKFLPEKINKIQPRSILETHDILTNIVGASIGRTCEYTLVDSANTNQAVAIIRLIAVDMVSYVVKCLNSDYCVNLMFANQVNVARANLSLSSLANFLIPIPPLKEMYRIIAHLDCSLRHISGIQSSEDELRQLILFTKTKILDLAIRGQLVPQNPDDEPASVLLERIRAEKEELIKQGKIKRDKKESVIFKGDDNSYYEKIGNKVNCIDEEIPFELPEGWAFIRLKIAWELISGRDLSPSEYNDKNDGIPYITGASNFRNGHISLVRWTTVPQVITRRGDLLLTCKGTIGEIAHNNFGEAHIARQIMAIRNIYSLNVDFLALCIEYSMTKIKQAAKGLIPGISREDILNLVIPIPPIKEQENICNKLKVTFSAIEHIEKSLN